MNIKEKILRAEDEAAKAFACSIKMDYGILYYNDDDKESHDSNHAILYPDKISDIDPVLQEIKDFYLSRGITPRIYQPPVSGYFESHREAIKKAGYEITIYGNNRYMLLMEENQIDIEKRLEIRRLLEWDDRIANDIFIPNDEEYEVEVVKNLLKQKDSYLFVGYLKDVAVATTYFHVSEHGCTSFDYIVTAKDYRNKGYAREVLSHAVDFCKQNNIQNCYQWPAHKTSEKMCYEAGFRVIFEVEAGSAVYSARH